MLQLSDAEIAHALRPAELYLCIKLGKWVGWDQGIGIGSSPMQDYDYY